MSSGSCDITLHLRPPLHTSKSVKRYRLLSGTMAPPVSPATGPTPQQIAAMQQQVAAEAQKRGITPQEFQAQQRKALEEEARKAGLPLDQYINKIKQQAWEQHQKNQAQQQQNGQAAKGQPQVQGGQGQQVPIQPGAPDPKTLAVAKWLRGQDLKTRTCILNGQRKDMFKSRSCIHSARITRLIHILHDSQACSPCSPVACLCGCTEKGPSSAEAALNAATGS